MGLKSCHLLLLYTEIRKTITRKNSHKGHVDILWLGLANWDD